LFGCLVVGCYGAAAAFAVAALLLLLLFLLLFIFLPSSDLCPLCTHRCCYHGHHRRCLVPTQSRGDYGHGAQGALTVQPYLTDVAALSCPNPERLPFLLFQAIESASDHFYFTSPGKQGSAGWERCWYDIATGVNASAVSFFRLCHTHAPSGSYSAIHPVWHSGLIGWLFPRTQETRLQGGIYIRVAVGCRSHWLTPRHCMRLS